VLFLCADEKTWSLPPLTVGAQAMELGFRICFPKENNKLFYYPEHISL
jgi:hypothetical protein